MAYVSTGIDAVIDAINAALTPSWLVKKYGRAFLQTDNYSGRVPRCFDSGDYVDVRANDNYKAHSFVLCRSGEKWLTSDRSTHNQKERDLSLIIWGNLKQVDPLESVIFTQKLKEDIEACLIKVPYIAKITTIFDEKFEDIYREFSVKDIESRYFMYPHFGLRFDFTVTYLETVC